MIERLLGIIAVLGSGLTAGAMFAVAISVAPALSAMPADRYVYAHQLIGRNWDPAMPITVLTTTASGVVLAVLENTPSSWFFLVGAVLLAGVSVVSHFCNVPINRRVKVVDPVCLPPDWPDPRPVWRRWHLLRTVLAAAALLANTTALAG